MKVTNLIGIIDHLILIWALNKETNMNTNPTSTVSQYMFETLMDAKIVNIRCFERNVYGSMCIRNLKSLRS